MTTFIIFTALVVLMTIENYCTYRDEHPREVLLRSYVTNLCLMVFGDTVMSILSVGSLITIASRYSTFGVLGSESGAFRFLVALVLFDLMLYFWHKTRHRSRILWKMHKTHHSDVSVNVTTAFRLHFFEIFLTTMVKSVFIVIIGVSADFVLVNEMIVVLCAMFHHTNITFHGEKWASCFMVVPYSHRAHHSAKPGEYHRNFGAIFSFWDRFFGTLVKTEPDEVGLKYLGQGFWDVLFFREVKK